MGVFCFMGYNGIITNNHMRPINKIVKVMVASDFFFNAAFGLFSPIFALFIAFKITGDNAKAAEVAGFAAMIYWIVKSFLQIPIGKYLDRNHGEKDDFWFMFLGHLITCITPFGYLFSTAPWHIYLLQVIQAIGMALLIPPWYAILGKHVDKGMEAYEWGLSSTVLGIATGITGAIGGIMVAVFSFELIFIIAGAINIFAALLLLYTKKDLYAGANVKHQVPPFMS